MKSAQRLVDLCGTDQASVTDLILARVNATPEAPFIVHGGRRWSYAQGFDAMRRFAGFLDRTVGERPRIATYLSKRPEAVFAWLGATLAGGIHVALHRAHKGAVLEDLAGRAKADLLVTEAAAWETLPPLERCGIRRVLFVDSIPSEASSLKAARFDWRAVESSPHGEVRPSVQSDVICVLYTSGTTGRSKAVLVPHGMYARGAANIAAALDYRPSDILHDWMPLSHVGGQLHNTLATIAGGGCLAQYDTFSRTRFWDQIRESRATVFFGFSNVISLLMMAPESAGDRNHTLRAGLVAHMQGDLQRAFERRFGITLGDSYGMSEGEPMTLPSPDTPPGSCGRPGPDFELAILDENDNRLPPGAVGRIVMRPRAPHVMMKGYEDDDEAAVQAWRNLWFHTQDLGRIDDEGFVWYVDRLKHSIRRGGENVSSIEVERTLLTHPDVHECAVVGVPDPLTVEAVKAVVVAKTGVTIDPRALHAFAKEHMARFMVPRYIEFRDVLPYTDVGKVKRDLLRDLGPEVWDAERQSA
ncbi:MAG: AMP-binding protein [Alphaproteobacteria bacterium]